MNKLLTLLFAMTTISVFGQTCIQTDLSKNFNYFTTIKRIKMNDSSDSCIIVVTVKSKLSKKTISNICLSSTFLLNENSFVSCDNVRSYATGKNRNAQVLDNDYGDLIVADFNFDNREDFAVKREEGGNGGPLYNYYIQKADTTFKLDKFLSNTIIYFPTNINNSKKTLTTLVHANAYQMSENTYKLDTISNKWSEIGHRLLGGK